MDTTIKAAWVAALRSGEYTQGFQTLSKKKNSEPACHCVLGVLCELALKADVALVKAVSFLSHHERGETTFFSYDGGEQVLPVAVQQWAGLSKGDPKVQAQNYKTVGLTELTALNDQDELSFVQLADLIEADLDF